MNTDFSLCPGYEPDGGIDDQPKLCQQCKRYLEICKRTHGDFWWVLPQYDESGNDCINHLPSNSETLNN